MKRNLKSKKINTIINEFVQTVKSRKPMSFLELWKMVVGSEIALKTNSLKFKESTLFIIINDFNAKSNLLSKKGEILRKINKLNSNVKQIIIK